MADRENGLNFLLKAPKQALVNELFVYAYENRMSKDSTGCGEDLTKKIEISTAEGKILFESMVDLINECIFENPNEEKLQSMFSAQFHKALTKLIINIVSHHLPNWRKSVKGSQISLPKLEEFDWRVDIKSASDLIGQISVPTVLVAMKINDPLNKKKATQIVDFELSKESLSAMLEGLGKIRDQLNAVSA